MFSPAAFPLLALHGMAFTPQNRSADVCLQLHQHSHISAGRHIPADLPVTAALSFAVRLGGLSLTRRF
jgi:hypothetical protein